MYTIIYYYYFFFKIFHTSHLHLHNLVIKYKCYKILRRVTAMTRHKPFIVEFTGTPEAGKTTVINALYEKLINLGYTVKVYPESAEKSKKIFPRNSQEAKLWTNVNTLQHLIEAPFLTEYDIIIFDRGAMDRLFWIYMDSIKDFQFASKMNSLTPLLYNYSPDLLITFKVSIKESLRRRGGEGHIVTKDFLMEYNRLLDVFINSLRINKVIVSTDNLAIDEVVFTVKNFILENLEKPS